MKQLATVVNEDGRLMAEVMRPEACEACHACKYGRQQRILLELPQGSFKEGDKVDLQLPDGRIGAASLLAYGVPLVSMLLGLFIGNAVGKTDYWAALCALLMLVAALIVIKALEPKLKNSGRFKPKACPNTEHGNGDIF